MFFAKLELIQAVTARCCPGVDGVITPLHPPLLPFREKARPTGSIVFDFCHTTLPHQACQRRKIRILRVSKSTVVVFTGQYSLPLGTGGNFSEILTCFQCTEQESGISPRTKWYTGGHWYTLRDLQHNVRYDLFWVVETCAYSVNRIVIACVCHFA